MPIERKKEPETVPSYSLTGDLLSFLRCGLQYRYHNGSSLPPSRPVQLWYGEFIHGVMEAAYRLWSSTGNPPVFPWPCSMTPFSEDPPLNRPPYDLGVIGDTVETTLRAQGKSPRSRDARDSAYRRAEAAVNYIGYHLFPLVASAEERVIGTRLIPFTGTPSPVQLRATRYELHGIIDVLSDVQLNRVLPGNIIRDSIMSACSGLPEHFEVVVDYKGDRRPNTTHEYWQQANWQVQTYAWLRARQPNSVPVAAGVLIYVNELVPVDSDLVELQKEIRESTTDVIPQTGSQDAYQISMWQRGRSIELSDLFRIERAIRVIPITVQTQDEATSQFDQVVLRIEECINREIATGTIRGQWEPRGDDSTCVACDFRYFCPDPAPRHAGVPHLITGPLAP